jgi:hypothetical protein
MATFSMSWSKTIDMAESYTSLPMPPITGVCRREIEDVDLRLPEFYPASLAREDMDLV